MQYFFIFILLSSFLVHPARAGLQQTKASSSFQQAQAGNGLHAEYFNGTNFEQKVLSHTEKEINFNWLHESPAPGVHTENYSIRWTGQLYAPVSGTYKVIVRVDDGVRLWLNGTKLLDKWQLQEVTTYAGQLQLKAGHFYDLKIEYYNGPLDGIMQLLWESPEDKTSSFFGLFEDTPRKVIPNRYLFSKPPQKELEKKPSPLLAEKTETADPSTQEEEGENPKKEPLVPARSKTAEQQAPQTAPVLQPTEVPEKEVVFEHLKAGKVVRFQHVLFEQGKYLLLEGSQQELDKLARTMLKYPTLSIRIEGHTDNVGDPRLNQSRSFFRAKAVASYLIERGVEGRRIETAGYGSRKPVADNATEEGRARNRRVEFVVK